MAQDPIVLVGGLASWPGRYRGLAQLLREISGSAVYTVPLTPVDWLLGRLRGYGQLVFAVASVVDKALLESGSEKAILVGHSIGGIACRLYLGGDPPFGGRRYSGHRRVRRLITLGTPHLTVEGKSHNLISRVNELFPGVLHEPAGLGYLSVAGAAASGASSERARRRYERFVEDGRVPGDGVVPVSAALLPGSETLVLDGVYHNGFYGTWYGSDRGTVERWWSEGLPVNASPVGGRRAR
jgi:pimeloyl-ACP methyl ester carboxylesterase